METIQNEIYMKQMVRIRYWYQETAESGRFVLSGLMSIASAEKLVASNVYERAEVVKAGVSNQ